MKKINTVDTEKLIKETFGKDYQEELGLNEIHDLNREGISEKDTKILQKEKDNTFISDEEWEKEKLPLPTF